MTGWEQTCIAAAQAGGWAVAHFRPMQNADGEWRTAVAGDGKGFPDLLLVHRVHRLVLFRECKGERSSLTAEQRWWRDTLLAAGQDWGLWRPSDWPSVQVELKLKRPRRR